MTSKGPSDGKKSKPVFFQESEFIQLPEEVMRVIVLLQGGIKDLSDQSDNRIELIDPSLYEVKDILNIIKLNQSDVGIVLSENKLLDWSDKLMDGMTIALYPLVAGG